jgi:hypothetical protein
LKNSVFKIKGMVRKSTKVLEILKEPIQIEPVLEKKEPVMETTPEVKEILPQPQETVLPPPPPKKMKLEKNPLEEEIKKLNQLLRKQVNENKAFEQRLEGLVHRKFLEVKTMQKPAQNYQPPRQKVQRFVPSPPEESRYIQPVDDFDGYLTQEEDGDSSDNRYEPQYHTKQNYNRPEIQNSAVPLKNPLFSKIFG